VSLGEKGNTFIWVADSLFFLWCKIAPNKKSLKKKFFSQILENLAKFGRLNPKPETPKQSLPG